MQNYIKISALLLAIALTSCEDQITVPLQTAQERLVVEASLDWEKGTMGNVQTIRLSKSTPFFDTTTNTAVTGASVKVTNAASGAEFIFTDQNNGEYRATDFMPVIGQPYTLEIIHEGETYTATETLNAVPDINRLTETKEEGESEDYPEVHVFFDDPPEEGNHYLFKFHQSIDQIPSLEEFDDEFVNGNEIDWWYEIEEEETTQAIVLDIELYATSEVYNDYLRILVNQSGGVGIFDSTPVALKGNCINLTNPDNYAHGFFRVTQFVKTSYTFQ
ncbi:MAG: DUF4249 family protein [Aurantibacter sp.]